MNVRKSGNPNRLKGSTKNSTYIESIESDIMMNKNISVQIFYSVGAFILLYTYTHSVAQI